MSPPGILGWMGGHAGGVAGWNLSGSSPQMALVMTSQCRPTVSAGLKSHQSGQDSFEV